MTIEQYDADVLARLKRVASALGVWQLPAVPGQVSEIAKRLGRNGAGQQGISLEHLDRLCARLEESWTGWGFPPMPKWVVGLAALDITDPRLQGTAAENPGDCDWCLNRGWLWFRYDGPRTGLNYEAITRCECGWGLRKSKDHENVWKTIGRIGKNEEGEYLLGREDFYDWRGPPEKVAMVEAWSAMVTERMVKTGEDFETAAKIMPPPAWRATT